MVEREVGTYREGDLVRVTYDKTGEGFQARVRGHEKTLFLSGQWGNDWKEWTFLDWWGHQPEYTLELVEAAPREQHLPDGWYLDKDYDLWYRRDGKWYYDSEDLSETPDEYVNEFSPLVHLYAKDEIVNILRTAAFSIDPDYVYGGNVDRMLKQVEGIL